MVNPTPHSAVSPEIPDPLVQAIIGEVAKVHHGDGAKLSSEQVQRIVDFQCYDGACIAAVEAILGALQSDDRSWTRVGDTITTALTEFELRISAAPELNVYERLGDRLPDAYREIAVAAVRAVEWGDLLTMPDSGTTAPPALEPDPRLLQVTRYFAGDMVTISEQIAFARLLRVCTPDGDAMAQQVRALWDTLSSKTGAGGDLESIEAIADDLRRFNEGGLRGVCAIAALAERVVDELPKLHGLQLYTQVPGDLVKEGLLTSANGRALIEAHEVAYRHPEVINILRKLPQTVQTQFSTRDVVTIAGILQRFYDAGWQKDDIDTKVTHALEGGVKKIPNLHNCSVLQKWGVDASQMLTVVPDRERVVSVAVQWFGNKQERRILPHEIKRELESIFELMRDGNRAFGPHVERVLPFGSSRPGFDAPMARTTLLALASFSDNQFDYAAWSTRLARLAAAKISLADVGKIAADRHLREREKFVEFLERLDNLAQQNISGIHTVFGGALEAWEKISSGDASETMIGAYTEAEVVTAFHRAGYRDMTLGTEFQLRREGQLVRYEFDLVATAPNGERVAVEIKQGFRTIERKNSGRLEESQMWRLVEVASAQNLVPIVAVADTQGFQFSAPTIRSLFDDLCQQFGVAPRLVAGPSLREIHL